MEAEEALFKVLWETFDGNREQSAFWWSLCKVTLLCVAQGIQTDSEQPPGYCR